MEFAIGDVVVLKSGGPRMTVKRIEKLKDDEALTTLGLSGESNDIGCVWFDSKHEVKGGSFDPMLLKKDEGPTFA